MMKTAKQRPQTTVDICDVVIMRKRHEREGVGGYGRFEGSWRSWNQVENDQTLKPFTLHLLHSF